MMCAPDEHAWLCGLSSLMDLQMNPVVQHVVSRDARFGLMHYLVQYTIATSILQVL